MTKFIGLFLLVTSLVMLGCNSSSNPKQELVLPPKVEVSSSLLRTGTISDSISLPASVYFLTKNNIIAPVNSYINTTFIKPSDYVKKGDKLFEIVTKEAKALTNLENENLGTISLNAPSEGQIVFLNHFSGDYVQEGTVLAGIVNPEEVYLKLFIPFRFNKLVEQNPEVKIMIPGEGFISAKLVGSLSTADIPSQTAVYLFKPERIRFLPEGLTLTAHLMTEQSTNTQIVSESTVLADEKLESFWVMKIVDDSIAVKVPVKLGIINNGFAEILEPQFDPTTRIITNGQYGLDDSTLVKIISEGSNQ